MNGQEPGSVLVWILAFAPAIGLALEFYIAGAMFPHSPNLPHAVAASGAFGFVTFVLNIGLSLWDEKRLKRAGVDTATFGNWAWLVPVYLYRRAKALNHHPAYFVVWVVCFVLVLGVAP